MKKGYYFVIKNKDFFVETNNQRKTKKMLTSILLKIGHQPTDGNIETLSRIMSPATCEIKSTSNGRQYYDINGSYFGGCGGFIDENVTTILKYKN